MVAPEWVGGAHLRLTGYSVGEMAAAGMTSWEPLIHPDDRARWTENASKLALGEGTTDEYRIVTKDGDVKWVRVTSIPETVGGRAVRIYGSAVDITAQRVAEERYRTVADIVSDVAFELRVVDDGPAELEWVTGSLERITGFRAEEWAEQGWRLLVHPDDQELVEATFDAAAQGQGSEIDARVNTKSGELRWIHLSTRPVTEGGRVVKIVAAARDITPERTARERLAAAVTRLNDAHALAGLGTWHWDEVRGRVTGSPEFARVLGVSEPIDITGEEFYARVHPDDRIALQQSLLRAEKDLTSTGQLEFRLRHSDGSERFVLGRGRALADEEGRFTGFIGTILDITERHEMEAELRDSEERYRSLVEVSPFPIVIQQADTIVYANPAAAEFLAARSVAEVVGRNLLETVAPQRRADTAAEIAQYRLDERELGAVELPLLRFDGKEVYAEIRWAPVRFGGEPATQIVAHDITERRATQLALENALAREVEAADRLREADRLKDAFLTQISHELRTPLTPIVGFALTLRDRLPDLDEGTRGQILDIMVSNADQMARMVERLLDFTQLQAGHLGVMPEALDLADAIRSIVAGFAPLTAGHRVELDVPEGLTVVADRGGLDRILGNLVANAVKYSPAGSTIRVVARAGGAGGTSDTGGRGRTGSDSVDRVTVRVEDEGPGLPPDLHIFERFVQGPEQPSGHHGTGVGLAVARAYVEMMGGELSAEQTSEPGARLTFTLPLRSPPAETSS